MKCWSSSSLVLSVAALALVGCGPSPDTSEGAFREATGDMGALHFQVETDKPVAEGSNDLRISIHETATDMPFTGATVDVSALMPAMAHDAPRPMMEEQTDGTYLAHGLSLTMAGRWNVKITASRAAIADEVQFTYDVP